MVPEGSPAVRASAFARNVEAILLPGTPEHRHERSRIPVEESDESGLVARALGESIFTQADSMEALRDEVRGAVRCHFGENGEPSVFRLHYVRDEVLAA